MDIRSVFASIFAALAVSAGAGTLYVDAGNYGKPGLDGSTPEKAYGTIQDAVDDATCTDGSVVWVAPGVYDKGGKLESGVRLTRVIVGKAVTIRATSSDPSQTVIAGQWDPEAADGIGNGAVRCVSASGGAIVWGFTLRNGAAHATASNPSYSGGFRALTSGSGAYDSAYLVECVVTNCTAPRGPAMYGGTALRCRFVGNVGGGIRQARLIHSLITGTVGGNVTFDGLLYNTTIVNNDDYASRGSLRAYNCAIQFNASGTSAASESPDVAHSFVVPWNSKNTTPTDSVTESSDLVFFSPATGDFHPISGTDIENLGDASILAGLDPALPEGLDAFVDLEGKPIAATGSIQPGAFQTLVDPTTASGAITFDKSVVINGVKSFMGGLYCRTADGPGEVHLAVETSDGRVLVCFTCAEMAGGAVYPQMDDTLWMMTPTNSPTGDYAIDYGIVIAAANHVFYVNPDPAVGNDANDGLSAEHPFLTLTNAITKASDASVIHAAAGTYTNGFFTNSSGNFRICNDSKKNLRIKGAGAGQSFVYGAKASGTETLEDGRGDDAVRCAYLNTVSTCIQGFTLGNSYSKVGEANNNSYRGGIVVVPSASKLGQVADCILTNGWAYRAGAAYQTVLRRCVITGAAMSTGSTQSQLRGCVLSSCLFVNNPGTDTLIFSDNTVQGCTIITDAGATAIQSSTKPCNSIVFAPSESTLPTTSYGCVLTDDLNSLYFVDEEAGDWRVASCSPAVGAGVVPNFWTYSADITGRPLTWTDGKPTAGAYQESPEYNPNRYVDPVNGRDDNSGRDVTKPVKTLAAMMAKGGLRTGSVVHLAAGTYAEGDEFDLSGVKYRLIVPTGVTVVGDGGAASTILDARGTADHPVRGAYVNKNATLKGVTICGGYSNVSNAEAAGFRADGATARLVGCIISNNYNDVSSGTSAGNSGSLYGCVIDHNRGSYTGYNIVRIENCTFGSDNRQKNGTTWADLTRGTTTAMINSIMIGGTVTTKDSTSITNSIFTKTTANSPVKVEVGCLYTNLEAIALNDDYTLGAGSVARDFCRNAAPDARLDADIYGGQRVYNGFADAGAVEYDCRGEFTAVLTKGTVVAADAGVTTNGVQGIVLPDGNALKVRFENATGKTETIRIPVKVSGGGALTLILNGYPYASFTAADGATECKIKNALAANDLVLSYDAGEGGEGSSEIGAAMGPAGMLLIVR